jgi:SAM-dependent methyltransferase
MTTHTYNDDFMQYAAKSSGYSANTIASILRGKLKFDSVLDVGCATGRWLRAWREVGIIDLHGVDGDYVDRRKLELPGLMFSTVDLSSAFDLGRQFDVVQSLEVGEHIEETASDIFAECLMRHARRYILFSAATPGQGGEHHINEQPYEFWRQKFERRGFITIDAVRPTIVDDKKISYWYRYNLLLFIRRELLPEIPNDLRDKMVRPNDQIKDLSPFAFRLRKAVVGRLPTVVQHEIARLKSKFLPTGRF